ncbi:hypothetical protein NDU88_000085 [Pleurodeles waltl]|uniref:Uncharacterized protein n=1 Tax=Pleurodeles waltl TaxID=8319 RepID=A0AAV7TEN2_PLEWA|nr:hypothetical protein NDU88_000085 [Pleurodeles waltl]
MLQGAEATRRDPSYFLFGLWALGEDGGIAALISVEGGECPGQIRRLRVRRTATGLLQRRPGGGLRSVPGSLEEGVERLRRDPERGRVRDRRIGPSRYAEEGGDKELVRTRHGGFPDEQKEERTLQIQKGIVAQALGGAVEMQLWTR